MPRVTASLQVAGNGARARLTCWELPSPLSPRLDAGPRGVTPLRWCLVVEPLKGYAVVEDRGGAGSAAPGTADWQASVRKTTSL